MLASEILQAHFRDELRLFGVNDESMVAGVVEAWLDDANNSRHRFETIQRFQPNARKILDMASGCGTFVFYGLLNGFEAYGIEPEGWKHYFNEVKAREHGYPKQWLGHFARGCGENLPFADSVFDCGTSYQTLEHVQDPEQCISELLRVTRPGGGIHLQCPDYRGTYEPHYLIPWLPLFPRALARAYLRLLGRPCGGLDTLQYTTTPRVLRAIRNAVSRNPRLKLRVTDVGKVVFSENLRKRGLPEPLAS